MHEIQSNRTVLYLEEESKSGNAYLHVFCPKLNAMGTWAKHFSIWSERRKQFTPEISKERVDEACQHPLEGSNLKVAWAYRFLMSIVRQGKVTGVEVKLMEVLQSKYNFDMDFMLASHGNIELSQNDKLVRLFTVIWRFRLWSGKEQYW